MAPLREPNPAVALQKTVGGLLYGRLTRMAGQTKFTPEKLKQISTLVESGKNRQEIAALLGVTVGSLQVTCSRLGISLRRGVRSLDAGAVNGSIQHSKIEDVEQASQQSVEQSPEATPQHERATVEAATAKFAVKMQYKGDARTTDLPFTPDMIRRLAFEAQLRDMRIGDFLGKLFIATMKKDLFQRVLEPDRNRACKQAQTSGQAEGPASNPALKESE